MRVSGFHGFIATQDTGNYKLLLSRHDDSWHPQSLGWRVCTGRQDGDSILDATGTWLRFSSWSLVLRKQNVRWTAGHLYVWGRKTKNTMQFYLQWNASASVIFRNILFLRIPAENSNSSPSVGRRREVQEGRWMVSTKVLTTFKPTWQQIARVKQGYQLVSVLGKWRSRVPKHQCWSAGRWWRRHGFHGHGYRNCAIKTRGRARENTAGNFMIMFNWFVFVKTITAFADAFCLP